MGEQANAQCRARKRRERVRELRQEGLTLQEIALRVGVSKTQVHTDLHRAEPERRTARGYSWPPFEKGNTASLIHGTRSERMLAPVREQHARMLAERYPWIDPARRSLQSQRLAQVDLASHWLDRQGTVVRNEDGDIFNVAGQLARWLVTAEAWFKDAEAERTERGKYDVLANYLSDDGEVSNNG